MYHFKHKIFVIKNHVISTCRHRRSVRKIINLFLFINNFQHLDEKLLIAKIQCLDYIKI